MVSVGIRELKNNLSRYLRRVQAGERVMITDRGNPVAEIRLPEPDADLDEPHMATYNRLVREGVIRPGRGGDPFAKMPPGGIVRLPPGTVEELIEFGRKDKWP
ncbi:MAG: type II toxin-antitoxin system prevent-host-death family antitoxin [Gemmatimonadaceae bacterium]